MSFLFYLLKKKKIIPLSKTYILILTAIILAVQLIIQSPLPAEAATYTVKSGDTLSGIGLHYNLSVKKIQEANGISGYLIYPGQKLVIPAVGQDKKVVKPVQAENKKYNQGTKTTYTVQSGDCLYTIAQRYRTSIEDIMSASNITSINLKPGQVLTIPGSSSGSAVSSSPSIKEDNKPSGLPSRGESAQTAKDILMQAVSLLGSRYVYGGAGPHSFDCSGFVSYVFSSAGYNLPHNAAAQSSLGEPVKKADLQPADLVFFSYYGGQGINHVGIYVGGSKFIHASSSNEGVIYSSLNESYYRQNYRGARRILN